MINLVVRKYEFSLHGSCLLAVVSEVLDHLVFVVFEAVGVLWVSAHLDVSVVVVEGLLFDVLVISGHY